MRRLMMCLSFISLSLVASSAFAQVATSSKTINGKRYMFVRGAFTQAEAWREARRLGGNAVVFETMAEHSAVINAFGLGTSDKNIAHTGHYQLPDGRERVVVG